MRVFGLQLTKFNESTVELYKQPVLPSNEENAETDAEAETRKKHEFAEEVPQSDSDLKRCLGPLIGEELKHPIDGRP